MNVKLNENEKDLALEFFDAHGVSERRVKQATGMTTRAIDKAMKAGTFPLPVAKMNGMRYWRLGDFARMEMGWA